jgi:hypothetical protein
VVAVGTVIGFNADSIRQVWDWIMMGLGAAFVIPNVLRWYWWRLNGTGYAAGTLAGLVASLLILLSIMIPPSWIAIIVPPEMVPRILDFAAWLNLPYVAFPIVSSLSVIGCLAGTWLSRPTDQAVLTAFYRTVRPFGFWGPIRVRSGLSDEQLTQRSESPALVVVNVLLAGTAILGGYLAPMYLVGHWHTEALCCFIAAMAAGTALYFTWYRTLSADETDQLAVIGPDGKRGIR